jgi:hypothetical protein
MQAVTVVDFGNHSDVWTLIDPFFLQMLALALLDRIVSVDKQQQWLLYISNSGYLKVLVDSLVEDDRTLQSLLTPQPPLLKALYTYESKMVRLPPRIWC